MKKLTICHISDVHTYFEKINMPPADVLCDTGDFTFMGRPNEVHAYNQWLGRLKAMGLYKHILVCCGNHEVELEGNYDITKKLLTNATYLENESIEIDGFNFYASPNTPEFFDWAFMYKPQDAAAVWAKIPDNTDVLMTHGPPHGILDETTRGEHVGCPELLKRIIQVKPQLHMFGHIHEDYGLYCFNGTTFSNGSINNSNYYPVNEPHIIDVEKK